ncbi:MAG: NAD(P)H-dependent oxidoreductase [Acetobacterium sp.]|nr:NAD(P)H-dependent oxidoreductase [Acetobacterium sp.]
MKTLLLNGSPRADHGNTQLFIDHFQSGLTQPLPVRYILRENPEKLALAMKDYNTILLVMPLYIHAMPGIVMKLFEELNPTPPITKKSVLLFMLGLLKVQPPGFWNIIFHLWPIV